MIGFLKNVCRKINFFKYYDDDVTNFAKLLCWQVHWPFFAFFPTPSLKVLLVGMKKQNAAIGTSHLAKRSMKAFS